MGGVAGGGRPGLLLLALAILVNNLQHDVAATGVPWRSSSLPALLGPYVIVTSFSLVTSLPYDASGDDVSSDDVLVRSTRAAGATMTVKEMEKVRDQVMAEQLNKTQAWTAKQPSTINGLWPTKVHIFVNGEASIAGLRATTVPDLASLTSLLTLNALLETKVRGGLEKPNTAKLVQALEALGAFRCPLYKESKSALVTLWPVDEKAKPVNMVTSSDNLEKGGKALRPLLALSAAVTACKGKCPMGNKTLTSVSQNSVCKSVFNQSLSAFAKGHNFPPDVTSSFSNLALGAVLAAGGADVSPELQIWKTANANMTRLVHHAYTAAYRPAALDPRNNVIDSRSYYVIKDFLEQRSAEQLQTDAFVTTWLGDRTRDGRVTHGGKVLPFYNVIDPAATATFLQAATVAVIHNLTVMDAQLQTLVTSNLDLINWILTNDAKDDLDLSLSSHPSRMHFYWTLARTMFDLENARIQGKDTFKALEPWYDTWNDTVRSKVKAAVLGLVQDGGLDAAGNGLAFVDDIVGTGDVDTANKTKPSGDDRLFGTACAAGALLSAWTVQAKDKILFLPDVPGDVELAVAKLTDFIIAGLKDAKTPMENAIYTTLSKSCESLPYWFPSNEILKTGKNATTDAVCGVRGHVSPDQYKQLANQPHFGTKLKGQLVPLNGSTPLFFSWSAPAYTRALGLLAVSHMVGTKGAAKSYKDLFNLYKKKA